MQADEQLRVGVTFWPAATGCYWWHAFDRDAVVAEIGRIAAAGYHEVRIFLPWDVMMPSHRQVSPSRLRDFEFLLRAVREVGIAVVPVLFVQSFGDCVMLPRYAVDRKRPRPGVRVVCDQNVETGGPRDPYVDPLMLEVQELWLRTMLRGFSNHPAIAAWDLGHDPATTVRPRRIAHLAAWTELFAGMVRSAGDRCRLTLGWRDVLVARGVRLAGVAAHLDVLGLALEPQRIADVLRWSADDGAATAFVVDLAGRLARAEGGTTWLLGDVAVASGEEPSPPRPPSRVADEESTWDVPLLDPRGAERLTRDLLDRLTEAGVVGLCAAAWSDTTDATFAAPPFDRFPSLGRRGLVDQAGHEKPLRSAWDTLARAERGVAQPTPWPDALDVADYYAALPESALDLFARWRLDRDEAVVAEARE